MAERSIKGLVRRRPINVGIPFGAEGSEAGSDWP